MAHIKYPVSILGSFLNAPIEGFDYALATGTAQANIRWGSCGFPIPLFLDPALMFLPL